jgi:hypothetical protein
MDSSNESEVRLAELIWRTVKLRVSLLILTIVVLIVVWSSLSNGNQEAQKIDTTFCRYLVDQENTTRRIIQEQAEKSLDDLFKGNHAKSRPPRTPPLIWSPDDLCQGGSSRTWIEITRNTDEMMLSWQTTSPLDLVAKAANERRKAFVDYDTKRHEAYRLQIQLSSEQSSSTIIVNALTVAKVIPFCVFAVLTVVVVLGFQQSAYRRQLRSHLRNRAGDDLFQAMAVAQFLAAPFRQAASRVEKWLEVPPVGLAMGTLSIAVVLLLLGVISSFTLTLVYLTDSIIFSYLFALYACLVLLTCVLMVTRRSYLEDNRPASEHQDKDVPKHLSNGSRWFAITLACVAIISLTLTWTTENARDGGSFRGFEFLLHQRPSDDIYALNPPTFRDARIQVTVAVAFVLICILDVLLRSHRAKPLLVFLYEVRRFLAVCVLGLSAYFLAYIGTLQYESVYSVPWLDRLSPQGSLITYNPTYGFWIFLVCCLLLVWLSFRTATNRLDSWLSEQAQTCLLGLRLLAARHPVLRRGAGRRDTEAQSRK